MVELTTSDWIVQSWMMQMMLRINCVFVCVPALDELCRVCSYGLLSHRLKSSQDGEATEIINVQEVTVTGVSPHRYQQKLLLVPFTL